MGLEVSLPDLCWLNLGHRSPVRLNISELTGAVGEADVDSVLHIYRTNLEYVWNVHLTQLHPATDCTFFKKKKKKCKRQNMLSLNFLYMV